MYLSGAGLVRWRLTALPVFAGVFLLILNSGVASGFCQDAAVAVASEEKPVPTAAFQSCFGPSLGQEVLRSISPGQQIVKIFHDELTALLGGDAQPLVLSAPARIMLVGLHGAGKTTSAAKLALLLKKQGKAPLLFALDLHRPAAIDQLATLAKQVGVPIFRPVPGETDLLPVGRAGLKWTESQTGNVQIFDTAGRLEIDDVLVAELKQLRDFLQPQEVLLVCDAATGQQAVTVATHFHQALGLTGLILTKLDGDARGGAALSLREVTQQPIKFAGVGEKIDDMEPFNPDGYVEALFAS